MRNLALLAPALLAACAANAPPPQQTTVHGETPGHKCETAGTEQFAGQPGTSATGAAIMRSSHAAVLRWAPPGVMLTMDYREDRVTIWLDPARKIAQIKCG